MCVFFVGLSGKEILALFFSGSQFRGNNGYLNGVSSGGDPLRLFR